MVLDVSPPHRRRRELLLKLPKSGVGCEVGVWKGDFSAELLRVTEPSELHLVDPWASNMAYPEEWYSIPQEGMDSIFDDVAARFADDPRVHVHRSASPAGAGEFPDGFFDWVYVDGDHSYDGVAADLEAWYPKVKPGGVLCGDDYDTTHWWADAVVRAVAEFTDRFPVSQVNISGDQFWLCT